MNKFEQVSSDGHQISLAGGSRFDVQWGMVLYSEVQCIMGNGHMGSTANGQTDTQTDTCENITFLQLCKILLSDSMLNKESAELLAERVSSSPSFY